MGNGENYDTQVSKPIDRDSNRGPVEKEEEC
jgi:hypothetical protein